MRISGGGRCNVTHAWDPRELATHYPRGSRPLQGPFSRFACGDAIAWFDEHGLTLVEEPDGRMFPQQNRSEAVIQCLQKAARASVVQLRTKAMVQQVRVHPEGGFVLEGRGMEPLHARRLMLATGGHPSGRKLAASLGHQVVPPVPSLFSLTLQAPALTACSGIAVDDVGLDLTLGKERFRQTGRVLITHRGLSGPATLRLSAFAARHCIRAVTRRAEAGLECWLRRSGLTERFSNGGRSRPGEPCQQRSHWTICHAGFGRPS